MIHFRKVITAEDQNFKHYSVPSSLIKQSFHLNPIPIPESQEEKVCCLRKHCCNDLDRNYLNSTFYSDRGFLCELSYMVASKTEELIF